MFNTWQVFSSLVKLTVISQTLLLPPPSLHQPIPHLLTFASYNHTIIFTGSFCRAPTSKHQNSSEDTISVPQGYNADWQLQCGFTAQMNSVPEKLTEYSFFKFDQSRFLTRCSINQTTAAQWSGFYSQTSSTATARVLNRPQDGMWPTRWLNGPFLFPNHLKLCPLRWKHSPLQQRERNPSLRYQ